MNKTARQSKVLLCRCNPWWGGGGGGGREDTFFKLQVSERV